MKLKLVRTDFWTSSHPVDAHEKVIDGLLYKVSDPIFHPWHGEWGNQVEIYEFEGLAPGEKVVAAATVHCSCCGASWVEYFTQEQWDFRYVEEGRIMVTCLKCQNDIEQWHRSEMMELEMCEALAKLQDEDN